MFLRKVTDNAAPKDSSQYMKSCSTPTRGSGCSRALPGDFSAFDLQGGNRRDEKHFLRRHNGVYTPYLPLLTGVLVGTSSGTPGRSSG